jgi:hypothetical protein
MGSARPPPSCLADKGKKTMDELTYELRARALLVLACAFISGLTTTAIAVSPFLI